MSPIIVALDVNSEQQCWAIVDHMRPEYCALKIGSELFTYCGPHIVHCCIERGFRVFLDLKFHDIPTTVACAVKAAAELGVWMVNVHAMGGPAMLHAAREALVSYAVRPLLIAVTVLTSHDEHTLHHIGLEGPLQQQVLRLAKLAAEAGCDGVVCAGHEVSTLKKIVGQHFLTVTPGMRLSTDRSHDQKRILTPLAAKQQGADYLVLGRLLTQHAHPTALLEQLYRQLTS